MRTLLSALLSDELSTVSVEVTVPAMAVPIRGFAGAPGETRTPNLLIRSQMLYPLSYGCLVMRV